MDMKCTEPSLLCGYSYAYWRTGYKPQVFDEFEKILIIHDRLKPHFVEPNPKHYDLVEQIIDSFGKLGYLFLSKDRIKEVNGKINQGHLYVYYYTYNFIYDCKSFLDSIAVILNSYYELGKNEGDIDLKKGKFRDEVCNKQPKLRNTMKQYQKWFDNVVKWRDSLIHKFSVPIGTPITYVPSHEELNEMQEIPYCKMLIEPQPFLSANFPELEKRYGTAFIDIEDFCEEWITNACNFYNKVCDVIADDLK